MALRPGSDEQLRFAKRGALRINQLALGAAAILLLTGIGNVFNAVRMRQGRPSSEFDIILAIKIVLFALMLTALHSALRTCLAAKREAESGRTEAVPRAMTSMTGAHLAVLAMGAAAMVLGMWIVGS